MKNLKTKGIFTILFVLTIYLALSLGNVFAVDNNKIYVPVFMTVKDANGHVFENNEIAEFKPGDKIYVSAYCNNAESKAWAQNSNFMEDWGFKVNSKGMAIISYMFDSTDSKDYTRSSDPTELTITIPNYAAGTRHYVVIDAVAAIDGLPTEDGKEYQATTGTFAIKFTIAENTSTDPLSGSVSASGPNGTLSTSYVNEVEAGDSLTLSGSPADNFLKLTYNWDNGTNYDISGSSGRITVPDFEPGTTHTLTVTGTLKDGTVVSKKVYKITIPVDDEEELTGKITVKMDGKTLTSGSTYTVTGDEEIVVTGSPASNFESLTYRWDGDYEDTVRDYETVFDVLADEGVTHELKVFGTLKDGSKLSTKTFYFVVEEDDELIVEPWMRENPDAEGLIVSLRNDSEEDKANKNFYMLDEEIIYYVDYMNAGKDINNPVKLVLKLPLSFKVVDSGAGTVSKSDKTITWTFPDGLEEGQAGTKTVVIEYTALSKKSYDYEIVYPQATIYKSNKKADTSTVINFIYEDESTVISDEHDPYMFGDHEKPTFRPDDTISRAEGALVLTRIFGVSTSNIKVTSIYSDINETYPEAQRAITAATELGIINGYKDGTYRPNDKMTRAEFMKIIASYIELVGEEKDIEGLEVKYESSIKVYNNSTYRDHWALSYATLLARLNMVDVSKNNRNLRLDDDITRAEVAQLINFYSFRAPAKVTASTRVDFTDVSRNHKLFEDIVEATRDSHKYTITEDGKERAK